MFFFLMIRRPPRSTQSRSSAASDVYKRQVIGWGNSQTKYCLSQGRQQQQYSIHQKSRFHIHYATPNLQFVGQRFKHFFIFRKQQLSTLISLRQESKMDTQIGRTIYYG
eukprot:TRINITY_DN504_c0_g3_i4.p3 TRINITY_DN504_c0_g3~~TRINITY_DN504_c0_g3_i4.p3  ORF type:complete len:109 (+),score=30.12 TRINITY_DN504_c0_g3_i4:8-334(+)